MKKSLIFILIISYSSVNYVFSQNGVVKSYYPDRKIKSESSYLNDILDGPLVLYYENGKIKEEKSFSKGILNSWVREYYENGLLKKEYYVDSGVKNSDEKFYSDNGILVYIKSYQNGVLIREQNFESASVTPTLEVAKTETNLNTTVLDKIIEAYPKESVTEIEKKIIYPVDALKYGLEGKVKILAEIDSIGNVIKSEIVKGIGLGCDQEALRIIADTKFNPAKKGNQNISSQIALELSFKIPKQTENAVADTHIEPEIKPTRKYESNLSVICEADRCPRPEDDLATIYSRFKIPNVAIALKIKGMILIEGIVDKDGNLKQTKIIEGVGYGCDQLVEDSLIKSKFIPASKKGEPIETKALINFPFNYEMR